MTTLDPYLLVLSFLISTFYNLAYFAIAYTTKSDKVTDFAGGTNAAIIAIVTTAVHQYQTSREINARNIVAACLISLWGIRLAGFLLFRILKTGKDQRFNEIRDKFFPFLGFWIGQIVWGWTITLPITILNSQSVADYPQPAFGSASDIIGIILWIIGFMIETIADAQKYAFRSKVQTGASFMSTGVFSWTRFPNYFGEITQWWAIWALCIQPALSGSISNGGQSALYGSIASPLFTMALLLFASGIPTQEPSRSKKFYEMQQSSSGDDSDQATIYDRYCQYQNNTSILIPMPPGTWKILPAPLKTLLFDWPLYEFNHST